VKYKTIYFCLLFGCFQYYGSAQVKIGNNPQDINAGSLLELESTTKSLVLTRVTSIEMQAMQPPAGAIVYNTDENCVFFYNSTQWVSLCIIGANYQVINNEDGTYTFVNDESVGAPVVVNTAPNGENGSVIFSDAAGQLTENNSNLYWDNTDTSLGIRTNTPSSTLEVKGSLATDIRFVAGSSIGLSRENHTIIVNGTGLSTLFLPKASSATGRIYIIKRSPEVDISVFGGYFNERNARTTEIPDDKFILWLQSNGFTWEQIN